MTDDGPVMGGSTTFSGGKYTVVQRPSGRVELERYGQTWIIDPQAAKAWLAAAAEIDELRAEVDQLTIAVMEAGK